MAGPIDFILRLIDKMSGPADQASGSVDKLGGAIGGATGQTSAFNTVSDKMLDSMGGQLGLLQTVATAWIALGAAISAAVIGGAAIAISANDFKGDMTDVYRRFVDTEQGAIDTFERVQKLSRQLPQSAEQIHQLAGRLLAGGVKATQLDDVIKAISTLEVALGSEKGGAAADKLEKIISKAAVTGKFEISDRMLVGTGVTVTELYAEIAKRMGVGIDQVEAMMKAGKISAEQGIDALNNVIQNKFGDIAKAQMLDLDVQWTKFKDTISELFADIDSGPFLAALAAVLGLFDKNTETGARLKAITEDFYNFLFKAFEGVDGASLTGAFNAALDALEGLVGIFKFLWPYLSALGGGFMAGIMEGFKVFSSILGTVGKSLGGLGDSEALITMLTYAGKGFAYLFIIIGAVIGIVATVTGVFMAFVGGVGAALFGIIGAIGSFIGTAVEWVMGLGRAIIDGLVNGIMGGAEAVIGAISGVVRGAIGAAEGLLKIGSPSKVFENLGSFTSAGFAEGITGDDAAQNAIGAMVSPPTATGAAAAGALMGGAAAGAAGAAGAGSAGGNTFNFTINATGGSDMVQSIKQGVIDALEEAGIELGLAVA
jgi:hypothetical protein